MRFAAGNATNVCHRLTPRFVAGKAVISADGGTSH
jgi:hypothetical protein